MNVIPDRCLFHGLALLPTALETQAFFAALKKRRPKLRADPKAWALTDTPRTCAHGPLSEGDWLWRVVIDLGPLPKASWDAAQLQGDAPRHAAHAFVFLLEAPKTTGLEKVRATLDLCWAMLDGGATELVFPGGATVNARKGLTGLDPATLDADAATALLVSVAAMGTGADNRFWVRTRGLNQFALPDLCAAIPGPPDRYPRDLEAAQILFGSVAPYVISSDRAIAEGETVEVGPRVWKTGGPADLQGAPPTTGALQAFRQVPKP
jgi:hypothetical protein